MRLCFITMLIFMTSAGFAQMQTVYYFKNNGTYVNTRDSADYITIVSKPDSASLLYNIDEFYPDNTKKLIGKSSVMLPPKYEGECITFYKSGKKQKISNYKNGFLVGEQTEFYPNGQTYLRKQYPDNGTIYSYSDSYRVKEEYDSIGTVLVSNGNGHYKGYDDKFKYVEEEGAIKNGERDSIWKGDFKILELTTVENYKDGKLITGTSTDKEGKTYAYSKFQGAPPQFKGGVAAFGKYLGENIEYPIDARKTNIQGKVIISFICERDGKISDVVVVKSVSKSIDNEAVRVIQNSPRWVPGMQFGRTVRVAYSVPINFSLTN